MDRHRAGGAPAAGSRSVPELGAPHRGAQVTGLDSPGAGEAAQRAADLAQQPAAEQPRDDIARLRASLAELPADQRTVLSWFYLEEMSVREIAAALSIPAGTVKSRLYHARNALRRCLKEDS